MSAGRPMGRTKAELERAAMGVRVREAIRDYRARRNLPKEFSYSLETRRLYDADKFDDRVALIEHYGDGRSEVYIIAVTNTRGTINDDHATRVAERLAKQGQVPFIGRWMDQNVAYEDVSVAIDHGTSPDTMKDMLIRHRQKSCLVVRPTRHDFLRVNTG